MVIDGVKTLNFTGDGLCVGGGSGTMQDLYAKDFETGSVDDNGKLVPDQTKVRTKSSWKLTHPSYELTHAVIIDNAQLLSNDFDIYFTERMAHSYLNPNSKVKESISPFLRGVTPSGLRLKELFKRDNTWRYGTEYSQPMLRYKMWNPLLIADKD